MSGVTKLGLALVLIFSFSLLGLLVELLYVLHRRRLRRRLRPRSVDPELNGRGNDEASVDWPFPSSKWLLLHAFCLMNQSRVEPTPAAAFPEVASAAAEPPQSKEGEHELQEEYDLVRLREMCLGPSSILYTIKEEEPEMSASIDGGGGGGVVVVSEEEEEEDDAFTTPCASPDFRTPSTSPSREAATALGGREAGGGDRSLPPTVERITQ